MYKIIACDLDETLLSSKDRKVSAENVEAIKKARKKGVKFVPATGRGYTSISKTLNEIGLVNLPNEYVISFNGGAITENKDNRLLHYETIPFETVEKFFKRGLNYDVCLHVYTLEKVYGFKINENERKYLDGRMAIEEIDEPNLNFLKNENLVKILFVNTNQEYLNKIANELSDITGNMDVSYSSNRYLEFNSKGVTKGAGLIQLAEKLGVKIEETIAIGDNFNDLSMIKESGRFGSRSKKLCRRNKKLLRLHNEGDL